MRKKVDIIVSITHLSLGYEDRRLWKYCNKEDSQGRNRMHFGLLGDLCIIAFHI